MFSYNVLWIKLQGERSDPRSPHDEQVERIKYSHERSVGYYLSAGIKSF